MAGLLRVLETVVDPDGRVWEVRGSLLPRPPRFRGWNRAETKPDRGPETKDSPWFEAIQGLDLLNVGDAVDGPVAAILGIVVFVGLLVLAWFILFPIVIFAVELLVFLAIAAVGIAAKVLFRRPWKIEARAIDPPRESHAWGIVGVRASGLAATTIAQAIERGTPVDQIQPSADLR